MCIECPHRLPCEGGQGLAYNNEDAVAHICHMQPSQDCAGAQRAIKLGLKTVKVIIHEQ